MYVQRFASIPKSDIESYQAPTCFELAGRKFTFKMAGSLPVTMSFAEFPCKEVFVDGAASGIAYECAKIGEQVVFLTYCLPEVFVAYILDIEKELVTRVVFDGDNNITVNFGSVGNLYDLHAFSDDQAGNKVRWILGKQDESAFLANYSVDGVDISRPYATSTPVVTASDFKAVKITDTIYLSIAIVEAGGQKVNLAMVSNYWNITCIGSLYSLTPTHGASCKLFAGYGRFMNE